MNLYFGAGLVTLLGLATVSAGAAVTTNASVQVDGVAAYVNAHVITYSDVVSASRELQQMVSQRGGGEDANPLYRRILDELINRKLILDAYENQREIKIPDNLIDERVQGVIRDMFKDDRTAFLKALGEDGQSEQAWREQIREQMVVSAMRSLRVDSQVRLSPLVVRERYERDPSSFTEPAKVKFGMIVIAKGDSEETQVVQRGKLAEVRAALAAGTDFADVARRYSEDAMAKDGGSRDWIELDMLRKELQDLVKASAPGVVSDVVEIGPQYALIKVQELQAAASVTFEDAYSRIERELRQEMSQRIFEEWTARLRRDSFVKVLDENPF